MNNLNFKVPKFCNPADCFMSLLTEKIDIRSSYYSQNGIIENPFNINNYKKYQE